MPARRRKKGVPEDRDPRARVVIGACELDHEHVPIDPADMRGIFTFSVIEVADHVLGTAEFMVHQDLQARATGLHDAVRPHFRALMQAIADHLGCAVLEADLPDTTEEPEPLATTVVHGRTPGRA